MSLLRVRLAGLVLLPLLIAQSHSDFGRVAIRADAELQSRIEGKLKARLVDWQFTSNPCFTACVCLVAKKGPERLDVTTHYMNSAQDAAKLLQSYPLVISAGAGHEVKGVGQQAFFMFYGSQAILRFRQGNVVVEVRAAPEPLYGAFDDGLSKRRNLVFEAAAVIQKEIDGA